MFLHNLKYTHTSHNYLQYSSFYLLFVKPFIVIKPTGSPKHNITFKAEKNNLSDVETKCVENRIAPSNKPNIINNIIKIRA